MRRRGAVVARAQELEQGQVKPIGIAIDRIHVKSGANGSMCHEPDFEWEAR